MPAAKKFNRNIFVNNVMRIKAVIMDILDFCNFIKSCLEWESPARFFSCFLLFLLLILLTRSITAFVFFMTITWYFEPWMVPVGLLLIFLKYYFCTVEKPTDRSINNSKTSVIPQIKMPVIVYNTLIKKSKVSNSYFQI